MMKNEINSLEFDERVFLNNNENYRIYNVSTRDKMYSKLHEHDFLEIFILLSGGVSYVVEQGQFELRDFDIILVPPHSLHKLVVNEEGEYKRMVLWISKKYIDRLSSPATDLSKALSSLTDQNKYLIRSPEFTFKIKPFFEKILFLEEHPSFGSDLLIDNTFRELLLAFNSIEDKDVVPVKENFNPVVLKIIDYIATNLKEELSLNDIAKGVGMDPFYISRTFSSLAGITIHKYIVKKRLNKAKKLLKDGYQSKEIISLIGFNDESHFIQSFKKEFGYTPKQYKAMVR